MQFSQLINIMEETGLSPEDLSTKLNISNMTYRRWLKRSPMDEIPKEYERNIAGGIYQLMAEGKIGADSSSSADFLKHNLPEFFQAAIGRFNVSAESFDKNSVHQDKITAVLSHLGNSTNVRAQVDAASVKIKKFSSWGSAWKQRITMLSQAIRSKELGIIDKLVAYGALFYLIIPFDLIPDSIPVFGYVDDFGIMGFACAYYFKRFPTLFPRTNTSEV